MIVAAFVPATGSISNSVTIGPNAMSQGTGGEFNIVLGQGCGTVLGNDLVHTALTDETMVPCRGCAEPVADNYYNCSFHKIFSVS